jgi:hypothetical protein
MDRAEILFKNGCRKWHAYFERCASGGRMAEASHLFGKVAQYMEAWRGSLAAARAQTREAEAKAVECRMREASIQLRLRMLGQLLTMMNHGFAEMGKFVGKAVDRAPTKGDKGEDSSGGDNE